MKHLKLIYLVIDGVADRPNEGVTALEAAIKPALDNIAKKGICGMMYPISKGYAPESDSAVLSILGYDPEKYYTGRGPLEALGVGIRIAEGKEVAFRANFATVKEDTLEIIDRRCGRDLTSEEASELAKALDGMDLGVPGAYVKVVATIGHRAVVVLGHKEMKLSGNVSNTDPAYARKGLISVAVKEYEPKIAPCIALDDTPEARLTAELVNIFTIKAIKVLSRHPVNEKRESEGRLKANALLLRDAGDKLPKIRPLSEIYGLKFAAIAEMPVEKGIARLLGMEVAEVPPPSEDKKKDYEMRLETTLRLLETNDVVYVHLKGPDEPGHDGNFRAKVSSVEIIDRYFVEPLLKRIETEEVAILVTADHATPYTVKAHTDDPVPVALMSPNVEPDEVDRLTERDCAKGALGLIEHGWQLLPRVLQMIGLYEISEVS
ncbi:MAG: phosphonopyruvate decarboxylase [Thermoprotei archaeon]|nr:MAG: phosphonopyruvate decarboxylase [Thermoprotei archaeon]